MAQYSKKEKEGIGGRVEAMRQERGWSAEKLAELLDTTRSSINMKERGERPFTLEEACKLCGIFDLTLDELVTGVTTKGWDTFDDLGLEDKTVEAFRTFKAKSSLRMRKNLNIALSYVSTLEALANFIGIPKQKTNLRMCEYSYDPEEDVLNCKMTPIVFDSVISYQLIDTLKAARSDEYMELHMPPMTKEQLDIFFTELRKGMENGEEK